VSHSVYRHHWFLLVSCCLTDDTTYLPEGQHEPLPHVPLPSLIHAVHLVKDGVLKGAQLRRNSTVMELSLSD
jgi:hypothetical protein